MVDIIKDVLDTSMKNILSQEQYIQYQPLINNKSIERSNKKDHAEYKISLTTKLFWAIFKDEKKQKMASTNDINDTGSSNKNTVKQQEKTISITSNLGLTRPFVTQSKLNELLFHNLPIEKLQTIFSYVGIGHEFNSLTIHFTTLKYNKEQNTNGMISCTRCGKFVKLNNSGLEWHIKNVHKIKDHSKAYNAVTSAKHSLIHFNNFNNSKKNTDVISQSDDGDNNNKIILNKQMDMAIAQSNPENLKEMIRTGKVKPLLNPGLEACRSGDLILLKELILNDKYNPKEIYDRNGSNGLLWASGGGHLDCVQYLIETCKINPNVEKQKGRRGYAGRTALHWSCRNGHVDVVEFLLNNTLFPMCVDVETEDGTTPFHLAVWQNQIHVCNYLINKGCDVDHINSYGCNAVLWAGQGLNTSNEMFELLFTHSCNFHIFNENGQGILHKAAQRGKLQVCELLLVGDNYKGEGIRNKYHGGLLYASYQYCSTSFGDKNNDEYHDHNLHYLRDVLLNKHFQVTNSERSRPYELAKYAGNSKLELWLLKVYNDISRVK